MKLRFLALTLAVGVHGSAFAQGGTGVGYATVRDAYEALKANPKAKGGMQGDWYIVDVSEGADFGVWSFAPQSSPAYPAVVKRFPKEVGGSIVLDMRVLCGGPKDACDKLVEEFKQLNERVASDVRRPQAPRQNVSASNADSAWRPSPAQQSRVEAVTKSYFSARDANNANAAYAFLSASLKSDLPFEAFQRDLAGFNAKSGNPQERQLRAVTWYKDAAKAGPGLFVAVDYASRFENLALHCGYVVWKEQPEGEFLLVREEANMIDNATMAKLKPGDLERVRAQFHC